MRYPARMRYASFVMTGLLALAGCKSSEPNIKPPPNKEEFILPPADDPRFSSYPSYPKGTLNQEYIKRDKDRKENKDDPGLRPGGPGRLGAGGSNY